jgi:hypothetical protein
MLMGRLGMAMSPHRLLTTLGVVAFAVMVRCGAVALRRVFVVFCCFGVGFLRHPILFCVEFQHPNNALTASWFPFETVVVGRRGRSTTGTYLALPRYGPVRLENAREFACTKIAGRELETSHWFRGAGMLSMSAARVTKFEKPGPAPESGDGTGSQAAQAIGRALEAHYASLIEAPLPDKFVELLARLEQDQVSPKQGKRDAHG